MPKPKKEPPPPPPPHWTEDPTDVLEYYDISGLHVGKPVEVDGRSAVVVGFKGYNMVVVYDDDDNQSPYIAHPTWRVKHKRKKASS